MDEARRRVTVHDVARVAGVSLATVDRVLNGRPGVRAETAERVAEAIRALDFRRDLSASLLARSRDLSISFLLPGGGNAFMQQLAAAIGRRAEALKGERVSLGLRTVPAFDGTALARAIDGLDPKLCDCAVIVATEHPRVRDAVDQAGRRGIPILTLVSDLAGSARRHFIGIDNLAAGRTAASLLGRFCPRGRIGLVAGSLNLFDHQQRLDGFRAVATVEFPGLEIVGPLEGHDDDSETERAVTRLIAEQGPLDGLYSIGAGTAGVIHALARGGLAGRMRVVAHELTDAARDGLKTGTIDVVLDQNPDREIAAALAMARSVVMGLASPSTDPIEIGLYLRDNLVS
jgi:LacI family transcriptional regulator